MAARRRKGASGRAKSSEARATGIPGGMMEGLQQIWLAGVGALSRAQREGPAAFQEAVTEGLRILDRSRSGADAWCARRSTPRRAPCNPASMM